MGRWFVRCEWITCIESSIAELEARFAPVTVGARLGEHLHAAVSEPVIFGRERVLIDSNLADRCFGRQSAAGKAVDKDFAAARTHGRTSQRLQILFQSVSIIRQRFQRFSLHDHCAGIACRIDSDFALIRHRDFRLHSRKHQTDAVISYPARGNRNLRLVSCESRHGDIDLVFRRCEGVKLVPALLVGCDLAAEVRWAGQVHGGPRDDGSGGIGNYATQSSRSALC